MPKQSKIRITAKDKALINKLNKSASNKIYRLKTQFNVTDVFTVRSVTSFNTRKEFNDYVERARDFTNRNKYRYVKNDYDVVISRREYDKIKRDINYINKRNKQQLKEVQNIKFTSRGVKTDVTVFERRLLGDDRYDYLRERKFNFNRFRSKGEFKRYAESIQKQSSPNYFNEKSNQYKENYKQALENIFGKEAQSIVNQVEKMSNKAFMKLYLTEDIADINFIYDEADLFYKLSLLEDLFNV